MKLETVTWIFLCVLDNGYWLPILVLFSVNLSSEKFMEIQRQTLNG